MEVWSFSIISIYYNIPDDFFLECVFQLFLTNSLLLWAISWLWTPILPKLRVFLFTYLSLRVQKRALLEMDFILLKDKIILLFHDWLHFFAKTLTKSHFGFRCSHPRSRFLSFEIVYTSGYQESTNSYPQFINCNPELDARRSNTQSFLKFPITELSWFSQLERKNPRP